MIKTMLQLNEKLSHGCRRTRFGNSCVYEHAAGAASVGHPMITGGWVVGGGGGGGGLGGGGGGVGGRALGAGGGGSGGGWGGA